MKTSYFGGLLLLGVGLSIDACSAPGVDFSSSGVAGRDATAGSAGAAQSGGDTSNGGTHARAGAAGEAQAGNAPSAGSSGEGGDPNVAGEGGELNRAGEAGAPVGGGAGGAAHGGAGGVGGGATSGAGGAPTAGNGGGNVGGASGAGTGGALGGGAATGGTGTGGGAGSSGAGTGGSVNPDPVCGNQVLESGEQCDDGNKTSLDACDGSCAFEQSQRANWFKVQFTADAFCSVNRFGSAFPILSRSVFQQAIDARVADGSFSLLFAFLGLADPKGPNGSTFSLGVLNGTPKAGAGYDGKSDLDWWYTPAAGTLDANKSPVSKLAAQIAMGAVSATGSKLLLPLLSATPLSVSSVKLRLPVGASSKPLASSGAPPGHLSAEHLSPALTSFASGGTQTDAGAGELCGDLSAASLKTEPIPPDYLSTGATPCAQGYTDSNTFLDVLVSGCTVAAGPFATPVLNATQPDAVDPNVTNPGSGGPYKLVANVAHVVNVCRDKNNASVNLANCLAAAAYSSAFKLATDRVIIK